MNDVPLPRPRKGTPAAKALDAAQKRTRRLTIQATRAQEKQESLQEIGKALRDRGSNILNEDTLEDVAPSVKAQVKQNIIFEPNPGPQTDFLAASEKEVFYGGARGGGKSYALIIDPLRYCTFESANALIIRRTMPELRDLIEHSRRLYPKAFPGAKWREQEKEWRFPSGARIEFGYAETQQDALRYQGRQYTWIGVDELPQYPDPGILTDLRGSLRSPSKDGKDEVPTFMRFSGNPGNVGSHWVREMFIEPAPWGTPFTVKVPTSQGDKYITRRFIPAKLQDNPYLIQSDDYLIMLSSLPEIKRKQWLEGDWDAFDNAAFPEFSRNTHVVQPFDIPHNWPRFRACDWGYSSPACVLWFAVDYDDIMYVYRELYTKGLYADQFAQKVLSMEPRERINYGILDSSVWAKRGDTGPGIAEVMMKAGLRWRPSDRSPGSRIASKMELHRRLAIDTRIGEPKLKIFSNCANLIRTLPQLPLDENNQEDVDTKAEDHAYDALRYGCMSRPVTPGQYSIAHISEIRDRFVAADTEFGY